MKKGLLILLLLIIGLTFFFRKDINEMRALAAYATAFSPENAAETFRSLYKNYTYTVIKSAATPSVLTYEESAKPLPAQFTHQDSVHNMQDWINNTQTSGLIIYADGKVQFEKYMNGDTDTTNHLLASVSKSVASALVGIAVAEGHIKSVEDLVTDYVPELKNTGFEGVTIKHTLQMSTGIKWSEEYGDLKSEIVRSMANVVTGKQDEFAATMVNEKPPGTYNHYSTINTHVLGMVLRKATGKSYQSLLEEKLWTKMGTEKSAILFTDTAGEPVVYGGIYAVLRDMLRFGVLYLKEGVNHQGVQIVPADWVKASVTPDGPHLMPMKDNPNSSSWFGYGYQWWIPLDWDEDYTAIGIYGQFIYVNPKAKVVIAKTSAYKDYNNTGALMEFETVSAFKALARHYAIKK